MKVPFGFVVAVPRLAAPVPINVIVLPPIPDPVESVSFPDTVIPLPQGTDEGEIEFNVSVVTIAEFTEYTSPPKMFAGFPVSASQGLLIAFDSFSMSV